jgi:hypothetical protein
MNTIYIDSTTYCQQLKGDLLVLPSEPIWKDNFLDGRRTWANAVADKDEQAEAL